MTERLCNNNVGESFGNSSETGINVNICVKML